MSSYKLDEKQLLDDFLTMVRIDSPSKNERAMADWLTETLTSLGCEVQEDDAGEKVGGNAGNLFVRLPGNTDRGTLMFSSHMDTVEPANGIEPVIGEDGVIRSKGETILAADDKAGLACILGLVRAATSQPEIPRPELEFSLHICEEIGLLGAKNVDTGKFNAKIGYILDDHDPKNVCIGSPGAVRLTYTIRGKAAHAGLEPEKGVSAIKVAAEAISKMTYGRIDEETTSNIGTIQGGSASNVVTESVVMKAEARSHNPEKLEQQVEHMVGVFEETVAAWREKTGSDLPAFEVDRGDDYQAVRFTEEDYPVKLALQAGRSLGWEMGTNISGGGTDGSILSHKGIPSVVIGVGMQDVHSTDEHIAIGDLEDAARLVLKIVETHAQGAA